MPTAEAKIFDSFVYPEVTGEVLFYEVYGENLVNYNLDIYT
jgi:hypothetical protein